MLLLPRLIHVLLPLCFSLLAVNCGDSKGNSDSHETTTPPDLHMDPELKPLLDSYLADAAKAGVPVSAEILQEFQGLMWADRINTRISPEATHLGICQRQPGLRYVQILRPNAERMAGTTLVDDITLKVMVYHELGHCLHDFRGHTSGRNAAVMNAYLQPARYFDLDGLLRDHFQMLKKVQADPSSRP